ncbi:MAG TPA: response regulator [Verrucomicrobiae bacterium]|jgi:CheY-like chemotaxis protein|nr:response regulator [Verrucomicrobiae bacterium]
MQAIEQKKEFGAAVKSERIRLGLSQETLAERADLHRTYITDIERGARNLSLETIYKIAAALGVSIGSLFARSDNRPPMDLSGSGSGSLVDVLLVEDDPHDVELTLEAFRQAGMTNRIHVVREGAAALDFIFCRRAYANRRIETNPKVILLDLNLPKVNGLEVLRQVKADDRTRYVQVVVLTMSRQDEHVRTAMALGAAAYIVKPVDFDNFSKVTPKLSLHWALLGSNLTGTP